MQHLNVVRGERIILCFLSLLIHLPALIGSLTIGTTFFLSFLVGILSDKIGLRLTSILGSVLATVGMGLSAWLYQRIEVLYFTYGIMFGTGASLVYTPSLTILGHYFKKKLGVVNGIVTAGSSVFTIGLSFINQYILDSHGVGETVRGVLTNIVLSAGSLSPDDDRAVLRVDTVRPLLRASPHTNTSCA